MAIKGHLTDESSLNEGFRAGWLPLTDRFPRNAILGNKLRPQQVYMLDLKQCTQEQRDWLAHAMHKAGQGPLAEAIEHVSAETELPIRSMHFRVIEVVLKSGQSLNDCI